MKKPSSTKPRKPAFTAVNKASEQPGAFDDALRAIIRAPKAKVEASIAREQAGKAVRSIAKGKRI